MIRRDKKKNKNKQGLKILVGTDGSKGAAGAIEGLKYSGFPLRSSALVLSAADVFLPAGKPSKMPAAIKNSIQKSRDIAQNQVNAARDFSVASANKIKSLFPSWVVRSESCADSPAWALIKRAEKWKADVIVVGARGHSKAGRFLGSVSQMVLTQATCSVRVERTIPRQKSGPLRILVGIDGSPDSHSAFHVAANRVWPPQTKFLLVSVIDPRKSTFLERLAPADVQWFFNQADGTVAATGRLLESFAKQLRDSGFKVNTEVRKGNPAEVLVREADMWKADCIFVGARGLTHLKRLFVGGVSSAVAARANCSVEVVRPSSQ